MLSLLRPYASHKLTPRSKFFIFIVYSFKHNIFQYYDPQAQKIFVSHYIIFIESTFPFQNFTSSVIRTTIIIIHYWIHMNTHQTPTSAHLTKSTNNSSLDLYSLITPIQQHLTIFTTSLSTSPPTHSIMSYKVILIAPQIISLFSPQPSGTKMHQPNQVHITNTSLIPISSI